MPATRHFIQRAVFGLGSVLIVLPGCTQNTVAPPDDDSAMLTSDGSPFPQLVLRRIHDDLERPVDLQSPRDETGRIFIVEQVGRVRISSGGTLQPEDLAFLDITDAVASANEQGLLGLAFHPDFAENGRFFVNYTRASDGATVISEWTVSEDDPDQADTGSESVLLTIDQPFSNHNAGQLQFGPDGMLYVGTGDGGAACDPGDRAQDPQSLLGKMLRLDVDAAPDVVPADNPFTDDDGTLDLVWASGLRNPWRYAFDPEAGTLFIADVGQGNREEINAVATSEAPFNFGWRTREGTLMPAGTCAESAFAVTDATPPIEEYSHDAGCSITGGYVYRGDALPTLNGVYFYSDFCTAFIRALRYDDGAVVASADVSEMVAAPDASLDNPSSFGIDAERELYILDIDGDVFIVEAAP